VKDPIQRVSGKVQRECLHWMNQMRIRRISKQIPANDPEYPKQPPILIFNASTRLEGISLNAGFSLITGWALRMAGYPVIHFVCARGMSRCVLGTDRTDPIAAPPCSACIKTSMNVYRNCSVRAFEFEMNKALKEKLNGLSLAQLEKFNYNGVPFGGLILPSLRWILRRHHLEDDEDTRQLARHYILSAENIMREFEHLLDQAKPQAVIVFNGMFYPEAVVRFLAKRRDIPVYTHEVGMLPLSAFFTSGEATAYPIEIPDSFQLSRKQEKRLDDYLANRISGKFSTAGVEFWPEMRALDPAFEREMQAYKNVVPIFTNVIFDTSQAHANVVFPHMFAWLETVLQSVRAHPETLFVIRAHPDELRPGKESAESVADWVMNQHVLDIPNVRFINAREYISSYDLIKAAKFIMVYNSTIGLEASILGKPVLCAGKARYTQVPTVFFPQTKLDFRVKLEEFLSDDLIEVPKEFLTNSRRVLYSQLFMASLPFDSYLKEEKLWKGYVGVRNFKIDALKVQNSSTISTILHGIQKKEQFLHES
jgi:hypothetical protein